MIDRFQIEDRASQPTLTIREQVSRDEMVDLFDRSFSAIIQRLNDLGEAPAGPAFAYYHNLDMENPDLEVGFPVSGRLTDSGEIKSSELPAGKFCTGLHIGPYDDLPSAWAETIAHATEQGHTLDEFAIEFYITDPREVPPEKYETEIVLPLK